MRRLITFRDFDWVLLTFVLIICSLGVLEIYSTTYNTKFAGAHIRQIYWIMAGFFVRYGFLPGRSPPPISGLARFSAC